MNKYWFKKYKSGAFPVTWEGWAYFAIVVGLVVQANNFLGNFTDNSFWKAAGVGVIAAVGLYGRKFKTNHNETFDNVKDKATYKQLWGALVGMLFLFAVEFGVGSAVIQYEHTIIGYPVRIEGEDTWFEFHAIKDGFVVQVPTYPKYSVQNVPVPNTGESFAIATYDTKKTKFGNFVVMIAGLPKTASLDIKDSLNGGFESYKADMAQQTGEEPKVIKSEETIFRGYPAIDFILEGVNSNYRLHVIYVIGDGRIFGLTYGREKESFSDTDFNRFVNSLGFEKVSPKEK